MRYKALKEGVQEIIGLSEALGTKLRFTAVDAAATELIDVNNVNDITLAGGGGTDMRVGIECAMNDDKFPPSIIVVMTDGYTPWPDLALDRGATLIVCLVGDHSADLMSVPSWAIGIKIVADTVTKQEAA